MSNRYQNYFENIKPDESLVNDTIRKMQEELYSAKKPVSFNIKPVAAVAACVAVTASAIIFSPGMNNVAGPDGNEQAAVENVTETAAQTEEPAVSSLSEADSSSAPAGSITDGPAEETISVTEAISGTESPAAVSSAAVSENKDSGSARPQNAVTSVKNPENTVKPSAAVTSEKSEGGNTPVKPPVVTDRESSSGSTDSPSVVSPSASSKPTSGSSGSDNGGSHSPGYPTVPSSGTAYPTVQPSSAPVQPSPTERPTSAPSQRPEGGSADGPTMGPTMGVPVGPPVSSGGDSPAEMPTRAPAPSSDANYAPSAAPLPSSAPSDSSDYYDTKLVNGYLIKINYAYAYRSSFPAEKTERTYEEIREITDRYALPDELVSQITDCYSREGDEQLSSGAVFTIGDEGPLVFLESKFISIAASESGFLYGYYPLCGRSPESTDINGKNVKVVADPFLPDVYFCDVYTGSVYYRLTFKGYSIEEAADIIEAL